MSLILRTLYNADNCLENIEQFFLGIYNSQI